MINSYRLLLSVSGALGLGCVIAFFDEPPSLRFFAVQLVVTALTAATLSVAVDVVVTRAVRRRNGQIEKEGT